MVNSEVSMHSVSFVYTTVTLRDIVYIHAVQISKLIMHVCGAGKMKVWHQLLTACPATSLSDDKPLLQ